MYEITIQFGDSEIRATADDLKGIFRQAAPLNQLPRVCPIDGTPAVLGHRTTSGGDEYFELWSTGPTQYKYNIGQAKKGDALFPKHTWSYYDPSTDRETVLWQNGQLTPAGKAAQTQSEPQPIQQPARAKEEQLPAEMVETIEQALNLAYPAEQLEAVKLKNLERLGVASVANITPGQAQTWIDFLTAKATNPEMAIA